MINLLNNPIKYSEMLNRVTFQFCSTCLKLCYTHLVVHQHLQIIGANLCKRDKVHATIIKSSKCIFYQI